MRIARLLLLLAAAGCATTGTQNVEEALAAGRVEDAEWGLRKEAERRPEDAALQARWKEIRARAAAERLGRIDERLKAGDLPGAERHAEVAVYYEPANAEVRRRFSEVRALGRNLREQIRQADEAMRRRDWVRARRLLEPVKVFGATFPEVGRLWPEVAKQNYALAMREGERFMKVQDYAGSRGWYDDALALFPEDVDAKSRRKTADDRDRARTLAHEAEGLLAAEKVVDALPRAREAVALHPESRHAKSVLEEVLRRRALELLAEEKRAREAGKPREALSAARAAKELEVPQPGLRAEIEARDEIASKDVAARLMASGAKAEAAGQGGAAWTCYALAEAVRPGFAGAKERRDAAGRRLSTRSVYRLLVLPAAESARSAPGSGETLAKALREAVGRKYAESARAYGPGDLDGDRLRETGLPPDGVARGTLEELWLTSAPPAVERKAVRYEAGRTPALNPGVEAAKARWEAAQGNLPPSAQNVAASEQRLKNVEAERDRLQNQSNQVAARQVFTVEQQNQKNAEQAQLNRQLQDVQNRVLLQTFETTTMRATHVAIERDVEAKLNAYLAEPPYTFEPVYRDHAYEQAMFETKASLRGTLILRDLASRDPKEVPLNASFSIRDLVVAPFPEGGIAGDPKDTPPDADLLSRLALEAAEKAAGALDDTLKRHGERFLTRATQERKEGRLVPELHYLGSAWQARAAMDEPRRLEAALRLRERCGLDPALGRVDVDRLPAELLEK